MTQEKIKLVKVKEKLCIMPTIDAHKIIPLINAAWKRSFAQVTHNKKAISERGWNPYNRNCLLNADVRATMTTEELEQEKDRAFVILSIFLPDNLAPSLCKINAFDMIISIM